MKRGLPDMQVTTETTTLQTTTLRFLCEDPDHHGALTSLRVTLDAEGIKVHDEWDRSETDYAVHWLDLRRIARSEQAIVDERAELALTRQTLNECIEAARCLVTGKVVPIRQQGCSPPECSREFVVLGPFIRGLRERCDGETYPVHEWPIVEPEKPR